MSCTRRNFYNLVFRLKTQNTINYLNVWFKTVVTFQAKSCISSWITMIPSQPWYDRCCRLGSSISLVTTKRSRIQPSPGQCCHKPLKLSEVCWKMQNYHVSVYECVPIQNYQALTVKPTQPQEIPTDVCFACWGLRLFLRCRWHRLRLWCWRGGRPRVDTCHHTQAEVRRHSEPSQNTSIMPQLQTT